MFMYITSTRLFVVIKSLVVHHEDSPLDKASGLTISRIDDRCSSLTLHIIQPRRLRLTKMAKLEIPSIVVNNNEANGNMEKTRSSKNRLSKQDEFEEVEDDLTSPDISGSSDKKDNHWDRAKDKESGHKSSDKEKSEFSSSSTLPRQRSHPKVKLLQRSHALRDDTSPPPDTDTNTLSVTSNTLTSQNKGSSNKHHKLGKQGSSQGSLDGSSPCLSRDSSIEQYTDSTGIDLHQFIIDTLHRNQKDRMMLLKIEQELISLVKDNKRQYHKFPQMSSYQRMLVHRVAAFFGMEHNVDQAGTSVVVNKTKNTRMPDMKFREQIKDELVPEEPKRSILKRDSSSFEEGKDCKSPERQLSSESRRSKSFEEREEEYEKARARIFHKDDSDVQYDLDNLNFNSHSPDTMPSWAVQSSSSQEGPVDSPIRSHESTHNSSRRSSQEDLRWGTEPRPWSSTDSDSSSRPTKPVITKTSASTESDNSTSGRQTRGTLAKAESADNRDMVHARSRPANVPKASSFGGISVLVRGDSITSTRSATPRLTKAESFTSSSTNGTSSYHLSPSCANCQSESNLGSLSPTSTSPGPVSTAQMTQPTQTLSSQNLTSFHTNQSNSQVQQQCIATTATVSSSQQQIWTPSNVISDSGPPNLEHGQPVMWAVSNMESVPPGSILINPQTGQPYLNQDGTVYRYNPVVPPVIQPATNTSTQSLVQNQSNHQPSLPSHPPLSHSQLSALPSSSQSQIQPQLQPALQTQTHLQTQIQPSQNQSQIQSKSQIQAQTQSPPQSQQSQLQSQPQTQLSPVVLYTQLMTQSPSQPQEQRHFSIDSSTVSDLTNQISSLSFSHSIPTDSGASGDGSQMMQSTSGSTSLNPQSFIVSALRSAGLVATTQGNVAQMPVYFVPPPSVPSAQPVRVLYPVPYVSAMSQPHQPSNTIVSNQQQASQPPPQLQQHSSVENQSHPSSQTQLPGQYIQSYPVMGYSQVSNQTTGENLTVSPYYQMQHTHSLGTISGGTPVPGFSYTPPTTLSVSSNNNGNMNTSQSSFVAGTVPMYGPIPTGGPTPSMTPGPFPHAQGAYQQQTQSAQTSGSHGICLAPGQSTPLPQSLSMNSPFVGYAVFPPQSSQVQQTTPTTPTQNTPGQSALFSPFSQPVLTTTFPMFRPSMQLMAVRSSTPPPPPPPPASAPPQGLLQPQYNAAPLLTKSYSLPTDHRFGKAVTDLYMSETTSLPGNPQDNKSLTAGQLTSLSSGSTNMRPPTAPLYGRGIPLVQSDLRLLGPPLQHQLPTQLRTSLVLSQQRPLTRFQSPQPSGSSSTSRPPKIRKQRSKTSSNKLDNVSVTTQPSVDLPANSWGYILEVQNLPEGLKRNEADRYLEEVINFGAKLQFVYEGSGSVPDHGSGDYIITGKYQVLAIFESDTEAQSALLNIKTNKFQLRLLSSKPPLELQRPN